MLDRTVIDIARKEIQRIHSADDADALRAYADILHLLSTAALRKAEALGHADLDQHKLVQVKHSAAFRAFQSAEARFENL